MQRHAAASKACRCAALITSQSQSKSNHHMIALANIPLFLCPLLQTGPSTPQASQGCITMPDLRLSLDDFLASKTVAPKPLNPRDLFFPPTPPSQSLTQPPPPAPTTAQAAPATTQAPPLLAHSPPAMATPQPAAVSVAPPVEAAVDRSVAVATPAAPVAEDSEEWVDIATPPKKSGSFGGLSSQFLAGVQSSLEDLGYDLTSADIMQQLVGDTNLPETLLASLASVIGGVAGSVLREMVRQWQQALAEQLELEKELAKRKQIPVWRCAVCGRYGCPVAPYIESYQDC